MFVLTFKVFDFQKIIDFLNFAPVFLLIWSTFSLLSAMKECFFFLLKSNSIFIAVLRLKLLFSGFDITRFHHFSRFLVLSQYHVINSRISLYWLSKWAKIDNIKILKDIYYDFNDFGTTFSTNCFWIF